MTTEEREAMIQRALERLHRLLREREDAEPKTVKPYTPPGVVKGKR